MTSKPIVWVVDDLETNLAAFTDAHSQAFNIRTFSKPDEVLRALQCERPPDALLCDVFFYDTPARAQEIEERINKDATKLRQTAHTIGADQEKFLAGIELMEQVSRRFKGAFPVFAYTSKGPYLLQGTAWDRIIDSGATVLLKNRFGKNSEALVIQRDIDAAREKNSFPAKLTRHLWKWVFATGFVGALLSVLFDRIAKWIGF